MICYLGLGSNLASPQRQLHRAIKSCRQLPQTSVTKVSSMYLSNPLGIKAQPRYYNMVIELSTSLPPQRLLKYCQAIEKKQHRVRSVRWGARTIDIDLLLCGSLIINTPKLTIPHPQMLLRNFVIIPLLEIAPGVIPKGQLSHIN